MNDRSASKIKWSEIVLRLLIIAVFGPIVGLCCFLAIEFGKANTHPQAEASAVCALLLGIVCVLALVGGEGAG